MAPDRWDIGQCTTWRLRLPVALKAATPQWAADSSPPRLDQYQTESQHYDQPQQHQMSRLSRPHLCLSRDRRKAPHKTPKHEKFYDILQLRLYLIMSIRRVLFPHWRTRAECRAQAFGITTSSRRLKPKDVSKAVHTAVSKTIPHCI
jgi:hypothetical protein